MTGRYTKQQAVLALAPPRQAAVEVTICEPHTHNGVDKHPGDILTLPAPIARILVDAGIAKNL